jgi:hypothetical protein
MRRTLKSFFSKKYVIPAVWALVIALLSFSVSQFFDIFRGPRPVLISGDRRIPDTMVVRVSSDTALQQKALSALFDSLRFAIRETQVGRSSQHVSSPSKTIQSVMRDANRIQLKSFRLPSSVGGYLQRSMVAFAISECPPSVASSGDIIQCRFTLLGNIDLSLLSPIFVSVYRRDEQGKVISSVFEQQYELKSGNNLIVFAASFPAGAYEIEFGFYRLDELDTKYPPFYARRCVVTITTS